MEKSGYTPPKVWSWEQDPSWSTNRPISGATHDAKLPLGDHPLQLYSLGTPNGMKITIMLEELLELGHEGAEYDAWFIDIGAGDQFGSDFVNINPNSKIPALLDKSTTDGQRVFESGSILLYLAEKFDAFLPKDPSGRTETLSWLFWQMGSAPYLGGGFGHFFVYAPEKLEYPINRFALETKRQLDVLDKRLEKMQYLAGEEYSIADIAVWPWYGRLVLGEQYGAAEFLSVHEYEHVIRWANQLNTRPAVGRGIRVNRVAKDKSDLLRERHSAEDFYIQK